MTNTISPKDDYLDKLKKTIPGDLTAIYLSFRVIVGNAYGFDKSITQGSSDNELLIHSDVVFGYVQHLLTFMIPLSLIGVLYLYFVSKIKNLIQIGVIIISFLLWMTALDIGFFSVVLQSASLFGIRWIDVILRDKLTFIGITLLWTFCIPIIYSAAIMFGLMKEQATEKPQ